MKKLLAAALLSLAISGVAYANDQYHVYKLGNGECEIDTREHKQMKDQRGTDQCVGHFDNRTDAEKLRHEQVSGGGCKCPSGQNC